MLLGRRPREGNGARNTRRRSDRHWASFSNTHTQHSAHKIVHRLIFPSRAFSVQLNGVAYLREQYYASRRDLSKRRSSKNALRSDRGERTDVLRSAAIDLKRGRLKGPSKKKAYTNECGDRGPQGETKRNQARGAWKAAGVSRRTFVATRNGLGREAGPGQPSATRKGDERTNERTSCHTPERVGKRQCQPELAVLRERLHVGCLIMHSVRDWRRKSSSSSSKAYQT